MSNIKNFEDFKVNENFDFIFKEPKYIDKVGSSLLSIIMNEERISEKSFKQVDEKMDFVNNLFHDEDIKEKINKFSDEGKRHDYCAEYLYDEYIKNDE